MHQFYLNDCLGAVHTDCKTLSEGLVLLVKAYTVLLEKGKLRIIKGWVYEKEISKIKLAGVPLQDIVNNMPDREARRLFYVYNTKYPIHRYFTQIDPDELLSAEYTFEGEDAINIAIVSKNKGCLLSLPLTESLKKDYLSLKPSSPQYDIVTVLNLHGADDENLIGVEKELLNRNYHALTDIEKLESLAPIVKSSEHFRKKFKGLTEEQKKYIFDRLDEARENQMLQPLRCNGTIIKHVSPHVAELRIVNPVDIRVYFHEKGNTLYFAKLALKSEYVGKNDQNDDIADSETIILAMLS